jgi:hypothetical protein
MKKYIFKQETVETIFAKSEEEAQQVLLERYEGIELDFALIDVVDV